jgi:hypothetical protein
MPTNIKNIMDGDIYIQDEDEKMNKIAEIQSCESVQNNQDDAIDTMKYAIKGMTEGEISMSIDISKEITRKVLKIYGLERITRKRFKKLLMGCGMQRNDAEIITQAFCEEKIKYTPLAVQQIIETINEEAEKEENR